ncbi:CVNH domain-containing protein [Aspergillus parasiticus]|uniref:CVNH domain-containing protein n=1 Tax=Aspergillus parasiticus TaxID=5067 RepID=A0A5N6DPZ8_ASPPA|nr:CVNH domain-containing protein [Aspergillus parasiticus]
MSFHKSCHTIDIEIYEDRTFLTAYSDPGDGYREMDLDDAIRNEDGRFVFGGPEGGFTKGARNIGLTFRDGVPWLIADLPKADGGYRNQQEFNLGERIVHANEHGHKFLKWVLDDIEYDDIDENYKRIVFGTTAKSLPERLDYYDDGLDRYYSGGGGGDDDDDDDDDDEWGGIGMKPSGDR